MALPNVNLNPGQSVLVTGIPDDASEHLGSTDPGSQPQWVSQDPSMVTITQDPTHPFQATAKSVAGPGEVQIDVNFKGVAFGPTLTSSFTVTVQELAATHLDFSFGTPA